METLPSKEYQKYRIAAQKAHKTIEEYYQSKIEPIPNAELLLNELKKHINVTDELFSVEITVRENTDLEITSTLRFSTGETLDIFSCGGYKWTSPNVLNRLHHDFVFVKKL